MAGLDQSKPGRPRKTRPVNCSGRDRGCSTPVRQAAAAAKTWMAASSASAMTTAAQTRPKSIRVGQFSGTPAARKSFKYAVRCGSICGVEPSFAIETLVPALSASAIARAPRRAGRDARKCGVLRRKVGLVARYRFQGVVVALADIISPGEVFIVPWRRVWIVAHRPLGPGDGFADVAGVRQSNERSARDRFRKAPSPWRPSLRRPNG